jgi:hypothetical protein
VSKGEINKQDIDSIAKLQEHLNELRKSAQKPLKN